ncbi:MAG TPA: cytochrome P450 [Candidatus Limnocylindrales bacterium]|nr:cytochrome P450 [Candidatus Limnocylindrales bacterium]
MTAVDADPHATLAAMREAGPVHEIPLGPEAKAWLITGYEAGRRALSDPKLVKSLGESVLYDGRGAIPDHVRQMMSKNMLSADPPDHTRLRRLVSAEFTPRRVEDLRPRVREISDSLIEAFEGDEIDLIDAYAFPLPFQVICELLGVPEMDRESFRGWSNTISAAMPVMTEQTVDAAKNVAAYVGELVELRRSEPDDALLSALIQRSDSGDRLSRDELTSLVFLLLIAGHETTVNLIGNAMYLLLDRPALACALRAEPGLLPPAIEEFLRYESPVKLSTFRVTTEPLTVGEVTIPAGQPVLVSLLGANRDPRAFGHPDQLELSRKDGQHLAFGHGPHFCLGAPLARMEGEIAIGSLLERFPRMRFAVPVEELEWRPGALMRGLAHLPVTLG